MPIDATEDDLKVLIGRRLALALRAGNKSVRELAEHLDRTERAVRSWMDGTNMMPTPAVVQAASWLGIKPQQLLPRPYEQRAA